MYKHYNQNKIYLKSVRKYLSVKARSIIENQCIGFYIAPKAISEKTIGNFKIFEKSKMHCPCK